MIEALFLKVSGGAKPPAAPAPQPPIAQPKAPAAPAPEPPIAPARTPAVPVQRPHPPIAQPKAPATPAPEPSIAPARTPAVPVQRPHPPIAQPKAPAALAPQPPAPAAGQTRAAQLRKVRYALPAADRAALDALEGRGILDKTGADGRSVLDGLAEMAGSGISARAKTLGYTPQGVLAETVRDLAAPSKIHQGGEADCVWTNIRFHLAQDRPADYVRTATALYRNGQVELPGGGTVKLEDAIKGFNLGTELGNVFYRDGRLWIENETTGKPEPADQFITEFLNDRAQIEKALKKAPEFDNALGRGAIAFVRDQWNAGRRTELATMLAPFVQAWLSLSDSPIKRQFGEGFQYMIDNHKSLFKPGSLFTGTLPEGGLPLGRVDDLFPGFGGYSLDGAARKVVDRALGAGAEVPMAFTADDGRSLHMATVVGKNPDGSYLIYDPQEGVRSMPAAVMAQRGVAALLARGTQTAGLVEIGDDDSRPTSGGRFSWRGVGG